MTEHTTEKKFSLNPQPGYQGQIEINGEKIWLIAVRKTIKNGNSWLQVMSDCGRYQFKLNDSTFAEGEYFGNIAVEGKIHKLKAADRNGSNGDFISGWEKMEIVAGGDEEVPAKTLSFDSLDDGDV